MTSTLVTISRKKVVETTEIAGTIDAARAGKNDEDGEYSKINLAQILCIQHSITFQRKSVLAFLDSSSKVNTIHPTFVKKLELLIRTIDVGA